MSRRQLVNLITLGITLVANTLANALPLNGRTTGSISDSFPVLFVPAGYVFAIWGIIYLALIAFGIYQALPAQRNNPRLQKVGWWFAAANLFNAVWIFFWHYGYYALTLVAMLGLLVSLITIYLRLGIGKDKVSTREALLVNLPFSIYLGWITVATIANFTTTLYDAGFRGGGIAPEVWTTVLLLIGAIIGTVMILQKKEIAYPLVLVWAFFGITAKQAAFPLVTTTATLTAVFLLIVLAGSLLRRTILKPQSS